jgi:hypothetical protein
MQELINLIIRNHPDFKNEIEGCSEEEISKLENLSPIPIPDPYKVFLRMIGKNSGRIKTIFHSKSQNIDQTMNHYEDEILTDYNSVYNYYKKKVKEFFKLNKNQKKLIPEALCGSLAEFGEDPINYFLVGVDTRGNDNGDFYLDVRTKNLRVVEICPYTKGVSEISPTIYEFLFNDYFRRETSTYLHNQQWTEQKR